MIDALRRAILHFLDPARTQTPQDTRTARTSSDQKNRFERIAHALTVGVITIDATGHVTWLNAAAENVLDITGKPALGRATIEVVPSIQLDRHVREALDGTPSRGVVELLGQGTTTRSLTIAALPNEDEPGAILIVSDETRLHELEQTRRDFVSNVAHELRTPLSSIKLMIETIGDNPDDEEARSLFLPRIQSEVDRLVHIVEELLDVARTESGKLELRCERIDLSALTASVLQTFEPRAQTLQIALSFSGACAYIEGDTGRLTQVIVNLIDNALRHTPPHGMLSLRVESTHDRVCLHVHDTGAGIPFNDLPHVFERFYVVDRSRARNSGGTGLGLAIVKQIVEAHGGTVSVDSELGEGAVFTCAFPIRI
jgi:two-component system phosphate regulon sensor histidine kinase PhoR